MKKLLYLLMLTTTLLTACSKTVAQSDYDELQQAYDSEVEKSQELTEENESLKSQLKYHVYESGTPTVEGTKIENNENASNAIQEILEGLESVINGDISNIVQYESSYTFDITTSENGVYQAMMSMNEESYPVFITIYLNSEFCYYWNGLDTTLIGENGWYLDTLAK